MSTFALLILAVVLLLILQRLERLHLTLQTLHEHLMPSNSEEGGLDIMVYLSSISERTQNLARDTATIARHLTAANPAGEHSAAAIYRQNLVKVYASHLVKHEKLSPKNARIKAEFEAHHFENERIVDKIEWDLDAAREERIENRYHKSGILEQDIKRYWNPGEKSSQLIRDSELYEPMYFLLQSFGQVKGGDVHLMADGLICGIKHHNGYYDSYVKHHAIAQALVDRKILAPDRSRPRHSGYYILKTADLQEVKKRIFGDHPESAPGDDELERKREEGEVHNNLLIGWRP